MARPAIPSRTKHITLYDSAFACAVCQAAGVHIHHIDKDHSNNNPDNLVVVCQKHHDEAHTTRELTQNYLTSSRLKAFREEWTAQVREKRALAASVVGQRALASESFGTGIQWGYINHARVSQMLAPEILAAASAPLKTCVKRGIVDRNGFIIEPSGYVAGSHYVGNTVYDRFPFGDGHALHALYSAFVDAIAARVEPIHLSDENWTRSFISQAVSEGRFIYINRGQYFRRVGETEENAHVSVAAFRNHIRVEYFIDTRDMFGTSSITVSFSGHQRAASLLLVKSILRDGRELIIRCSPIGLGVGFQRPQYPRETK